MANQTDMQAVVAALRENERFVVTSHEAPDGDALGSLLATGLALQQLGKDVVMYLGGPAPLPGEYRFLELEERGLQRERPEDFAERVLVAVDCASPGRVGAEPGVVDAARFTVNIDHHHDNPRFGDVNLVVADASSTGEVLADVFRELGVTLTPEIAEALYIALVTDTGRFQYANTTPKALRLAADLVEAGADVNRVFQGVYENVQFAKLKLLARALERAHVLEGGEIVVSHLVRDDFEAVGADRAVLGGDHRRPALRRGLARLGVDPRAAARRRAGAQGLAALVGRRDRRQRDRTEVAGRGTPCGSRLFERPLGRGADRLHRARGRGPGRSPRYGSAAARAASERDHPRRQARRPDVVRDRRCDPPARRVHARATRARSIPFATGLLLLLSGASTRLQRRFVGLDKRYETEIDLSARTSTGDLEGERIDEHDAHSRSTSSTPRSTGSAAPSTCPSRRRPR